MAVYERNYGRYHGELTPERSRFLILPRYAFQDLWNSKAFLILLVVACILPFCGLLVIYMHHNLSILKTFSVTKEQLDQILPVNATFFRRGIEFQGWLCFLMALSLGPALVAPDLRNNGLPLYLSRPFSRTEYVLGKMTVLVALMSLITWVPGLLLFFFQGSLEGVGWLWDNLRIGTALFVGSWVWILVLSLVSLAVSAWVKWKPVARVALLVIFFVLSGFARALRETLDTWWGYMLSLSTAMSNVWAYLFGQPVDDSHFALPVWAAWTSVALGCALSLWLLSRRIRAYEVVR